MGAREGCDIKGTPCCRYPNLQLHPLYTSLSHSNTSHSARHGTIAVAAEAFPASLVAFHVRHLENSIPSLGFRLLL